MHNLWFQAEMVVGQLSWLTEEDEGFTESTPQIADALLY
jgi:hypothetical protein